MGHIVEPSGVEEFNGAKICSRIMMKKDKTFPHDCDEDKENRDANAIVNGDNTDGVPLAMCTIQRLHIHSSFATKQKAPISRIRNIFSMGPSAKCLRGYAGTLAH